MPYPLPPEAEAAHAAGRIAPVVLVDLYCTDAEDDPLTLRMSSREFDLSYAANDHIDDAELVAYSPMFQRMEVSLAVRMSTGFASQPLTITFDGSRATDDDDPTGQFASAQYHQKPIRIRLVELDFDTMRSPTLPVFEWRGRMDHRDFRRQPDQPSLIVLTAQGSIFRVRGRNLRLRTHEDQQRRSPGDMFFSGVSKMVGTTIVWGKDPVRPGVPGGSSGGAGGGSIFHGHPRR